MISGGALLRAVLTMALVPVPPGGTAPPSDEEKRDALLRRWEQVLAAIGSAQGRIREGRGTAPSEQDLKLRDEQNKVYAALQAPAFAKPKQDGSFEAAYDAALHGVDAFEQSSVVEHFADLEETAAPPSASPVERRDALVARWNQLLKAIGEAQSKNFASGQVTPGDQDLKLRDEQAKVHAALNAPAFSAGVAGAEFEAAYTVAKNAVDAFEASAPAKHPGETSRGMDAADLLRQAQSAATSLDAEATEKDRAAVGQLMTTLTATLRAPISAESLDRAREQLATLQGLVGDIGSRAEAFRKRRISARETLQKRLADAINEIKDATAEEKQHLAATGDAIAKLVAVPSQGELEIAVQAAKAVQKEAQELVSAIAERRARFEQAAKLLPRLQDDAAALRPHARAPAGEVQVVRNAAAQLRSAHAKFADWAQVATWAATDLPVLEQAIVALEKQMADVGVATEARIKKVAEAEARAKAAIETPAARAFGATSKAELLKLVGAQTTRFDTDVTLADDVAAKLDEVAVAAAGLSRALAGLEKRLSAVAVPKDGDLSPKEKKALDQAREAAKKALDEVTEA